MKQLLITIAILASIVCFGQGNSKKLTKPETSDTVAKLTNDTPLLTLNDLEKVLSFLDDKLLSKDHKQVTRILQEVIVEAEKRRIAKPK